MSPKAPRRRADARASMEAAILEAGRRQLAQRGAAAVSLREIARTIGVVSSAVYRYVESRDALLTLLVADAYGRLADAVQEALGDRGAEGWEAQLDTLAFAMREWAVEHPEQWGLLYGAPVPGYEAPADVTTAPGTRVMAQLLGIVSGVEALASASALPSGLRGFLEVGGNDLGQHVSSERALLAVQAWCVVVGTISMEIFGQLGPEPRTDSSIGRAILEAQLRLLQTSWTPR